MSNEPDLFEAVACQRFGASTCFLCGRRLGKRTRTDEHIFPAWLQEAFGLWDLDLTLLNGTHIPYRKLIIPCCRSCNGHHLAKIENEVRTAVMEGPRAVSSLNRVTLFLWLSKILYGLLFKEGFLRRDRSNARRGRIVPKSVLEQFEMHHYFLQASRLPMEFDGFFPASIFVFDLQVPEERLYQFDFRDHPPTLTISMRLGRVGIIAALQDGGAQQDGYGAFLSRYQRLSLHPLQFKELAAMFIHKSTLFNRVPKYFIQDAKTHISILQLPLAGLSAKPVYEKWDHEIYAHVLADHTGLPFDRLYTAGVGVTTWLRSENEDPWFMDIGKYPWPEGPSLTVEAT